MKKKYEEIDGSFYYFGYYEPFFLNEEADDREDFGDEELEDEEDEDENEKI